jgi:ribosomal protein S18 acetylase RimI-like enzyme
VNVRIDALEARDIDELCRLARAVWLHHYPPIIGAEQTEYMLRQRYDPQVIRAELAGGGIWWDVLREDGAMQAFASSFRTEEPGTLKLDKLYVHPARQRQGFGARLLDHVCERARNLACYKVVLAVNKRNHNAIAAYRKHGFDIAEAVVKEIGGGFVMDDYVMVKKVSKGVKG